MMAETVTRRTRVAVEVEGKERMGWRMGWEEVISVLGLEVRG